MKVRLRSTQQIIINGKPTVCIAGDWVDVGRQQAQRWIAEGLADAPHLPKAGLLPRGCGVVGLGTNAAATLRRIQNEYEIDTAEMVYSGWRDYDGQIPFNYTLFWDSRLDLRDELLLPGFNLLRTWWAVYPLCEYETLAVHIGSEAERQYTAEIVHDLRVPVPNPVLVFIKRNTHTQKLMAAVAEDQIFRQPDSRHSFLRALYQTPGLWWPLPYTWGVKDGVDKYER